MHKRKRLLFDEELFNTEEAQQEQEEMNDSIKCKSCGNELESSEEKHNDGYCDNCFNDPSIEDSEEEEWVEIEDEDLDGEEIEEEVEEEFKDSDSFTPEEISQLRALLASQSSNDSEEEVEEVEEVEEEEFKDEESKNCKCSKGEDSEEVEEDLDEEGVEVFKDKKRRSKDSFNSIYRTRSIDSSIDREDQKQLDIKKAWEKRTQ